MKCPACKFENIEGESFCVDCGTELVVQLQQAAAAGDQSVAQETPGEPPAMSVETPPEPLRQDPAALEEYRLLTTPKVPITVLSFGSTHHGLVKENNEDALIVERVDYPQHKIAIHIVVLADGMGGEPAGEVFGQMAAHETWLGIRFLLPYDEQQKGFGKSDFWKFTNNQISRFLPAQVASANKRIRNYATFKKLNVGECGSTIVVAVAVCDLETGYVKLHGYNTGDARMAAVVGNTFTQISTDHTISGAPYRFLGKHDHVSGSQFSWEFWASETQAPVVWVLLYSDGLWNMLSPEQMTRKCSVSKNPKRLCLGMVKDALRVEVPHGRTLGDERVTTGDDNITIGAIRIEVQGDTK